MPRKKPFKAKRDSAKPVEPVNQATWKYTGKIAFLSVGASENGDRYLKRRVGKDVALISVAELIANPTAEYVRLQRAGAPLLKRAARDEFMQRVESEASKEPTFKVATKTGWFDGEFVFPEGLARKGEANIERYFDWRYGPYHRRLRREGSVSGWLELAELCRGKSRLITGLCLAFSGPVCGAFGDEPPGLQLVSKGGLGNTTVGRVIGTVWGGDRNPARKIGCGVSWNNTGINLEVLGGAFDQMFLYLDDMHNAGEAEIKAILNTMNGEGRGRSTDDQRAEFSTPVLTARLRSPVFSPRSGRQW